MLALALVALAALCWGISGGIAGMLLAAGWDPFVVAFYRGAIGLTGVLCWLALRRRDSGLADRRLWFWAAVAGIGVTGNFAFYFVSIDNGSVAVAATLMYCAPVYVYLVSFALRLEAASRLKLTAIAVVVLGVALLTGIYDVDAATVSAVGVAAGLLSGLCYAVFIFAFRNAAAYGSPQAVLAIAFTVLAAVLMWPGDDEQTVAALTTPDWWLFAALGALGAGVSFFFYVVGMRRTRPTTASIVAMVEPITAALFAVVILGERLAGLELAGMALILVMVTALSLSAARTAD